jgi:histidine triad (HIT) family protein
MDSGCAFCAIVSGHGEAPVVWQDERTLVFLDHRPLFPGHCLLIPKTHYETLADLPAELLAPLWTNAQKVTRAVEEGLGAEGSFVAVNNRVSQSVPHLHVHVVPRRRKDGLRGFFWPRQRYADAAEMERVRAALAEKLAGG